MMATEQQLPGQPAPAAQPACREATNTSSWSSAPPDAGQLPTAAPRNIAAPPLSTPEHTAASASSFDSARSRREYMDSLVPPSSDEFARISDVQVNREDEQRRRRSREGSRRSRELHRQPHKQHRHHNTSISSISSSHASLDSARAGKLGAVLAGARSSVSMERHRIDRDEATAGLDDEQLHTRDKAALVIQRYYRGYRVRRQMKGLSVDASTRWTQAIREAQFREATRPRARAQLEAEDSAQDQPHEQHETAPRHRASTAAKKKWQRAVVIAKRAALDVDGSSSDQYDSSSGSSSDSEGDNSSSNNKNKHKSQTQGADAAAGDDGDDDEKKEERAARRRRREEARERRRKEAKQMGLQYFLEMVDLKHRYGSNLRTYHEEWKKSDTNENFFYWLDYGEGRYIDVDSCPRDRLDREQVRYLSREERQYYLAKVDNQGRLCWAKNGARIDTTVQWKDSIHGIVPLNDPTPEFNPMAPHSHSHNHNHKHHHPQDSASNRTGSDSEPDESELEADRAAKYVTPELDDAKGVRKVRHITAGTIFNKLLRKSVRKNTWIFVADTNFRLYVGIKNSGAFQHSSFLQGSRISAAGLVKIKNGRLSSLSPLSGHYRPPAANFRAFVKSLKEAGVDMSHVSISKSYAVLVGLEVYLKTRQKGKSAIRKLAHRREKLIAPIEAARREEEERDKSESARKEREFLEAQERARDENKASVQLLNALHISPREPDGQKGGREGVAQAEADAGVKEEVEGEVEAAVDDAKPPPAGESVLDKTGGG